MTRVDRTFRTRVAAIASDWNTVGAGGQPAFGTGFQPFAGFRTPQFRKIGYEVICRGLVQSTTNHAANAVIFTLPTGFRPGAVEVFGTTGGTGDTRIDVDTNGDVVAVTALNNTGFASLVTVRFFVD